MWWLVDNGGICKVPHRFLREEPNLGFGLGLRDFTISSDCAFDILDWLVFLIPKWKLWGLELQHPKLETCFRFVNNMQSMSKTGSSPQNLHWQVWHLECDEQGWMRVDEHRRMIVHACDTAKTFYPIWQSQVRIFWSLGETREHF